MPGMCGVWIAVEWISNSYTTEWNDIPASMRQYTRYSCRLKVLFPAAFAGRTTLKGSSTAPNEPQAAPDGGVHRV